ncbi:putative RNA exonuclease [Aspergillus melleus]|uniref:putative RNA exonuclease n=1 Tax=Aspergillus melleus TaxID=138277 RepID=UPI001E8D339D|nr:uncharacterized protein LDX57_001519 [Aspergillus melleus]KAH8423763.1 hypothetical protein LDX57_001519 [Aspergillus melleus]
MVGTLYADVLRANSVRSKGINPPRGTTTTSSSSSSSNCTCTSQNERDPWNKQGSQPHELDIDSSSSSPEEEHISSNGAAQPIIPTNTNSPPPAKPFDWTGPLIGNKRDVLITALDQNRHSWSTLAGEQYPTQTLGAYQASPARQNHGGPPKRLAVALDCEMALTEEGPECVQLCAVDLVTGERIIDIGVIPIPRVWNWQTKYSGMSWPIMKQLRAQGKTVRGWRAARERLFKFIDEDTILVGQSLDNDLRCLKIVHRNVVDTAIVTKIAVEEQLGGGCGRKWALKRLAEDFLGIYIQQGQKGHSCMEDTLATREVLLKCLLEPEELENWAKTTAAEVPIRGGLDPHYDTVDDIEDFL